MGRRRGAIPYSALLAFAALIAWRPAHAEERLAFVGVALDTETRQADSSLQDYLRRKAGVRFAPEELEYGRVIDRLADWRPEEGHYVARATPYVYVAAEMLGADFEILATYVSSATGRRTYNSYFVVRRSDFPERPDLDDVLRYLERRGEPARFIYHSKFSTSSYFLPSLYFRNHNVFHMPEATESMTAIRSEPIAENSSTELVKKVASGEADLAAVFDGTKAKLSGEFGDRVWFVRLPTVLPNDLLVCSARLDAAIKERLREAIGAMGPAEIGEGDFDTWESITDATDARLALADLRWAARARVAPVTLEVRLHQESGRSSESTRLLEAARQAVRLGGSEFVLFDEDFHEQIDFRWTVEPIHDGAILLHSTIPGSGIPEQIFEISFRDLEGLTRRIDHVIHSRMHRMRHVWPYSNDPPIVIRDTSASLPAGTTVKVQRIAWIDPVRNHFRAGSMIDARIAASGFYKYELDPEDFREGSEAGLDLDAMSNVAYRVILMSPEKERPLFRALTAGLLALLVLAGAGAVLDLRRRKRGPRSGEGRASVSTDDTESLVMRSPHGRSTSRPSGRVPRPPDPWH